ncbi:MAG: c-type cytochrome [Pseudomonadota bacterium]
MKRSAITLAALIASASSLAAQGVVGDAAKGERVFKRCATCHMVGEKAKTKIGPILNGLIGRQAGTIEGYKYSKLNKNAGEAGLVWTPEKIAAYLPEPSKFLKDFLKEAGKANMAKGRTKMTFRLRKKDDVAHVVAYLQQFSDPKPTN